MTTVRSPRDSSKLTALLIVALLVLSTNGCVRRRLTVLSNPPGAMVYVDNQPIGSTPCSVDFTYYGTREMRLVKPGFETLTVNQPIPTPWYQIPPLDFVSDNFALTKIRDNRTVSFNLQPQTMLPVEEIIRRGEELRGQSRMGPIVPATNVVPANSTPATSGAILPPPPGPIRTFP